MKKMCEISIEKEVFDIIETHLMTGGVLKVEYCDHHKGCDTSVYSTPELETELAVTDYFESWWYEHLSEYLTSHEAFGDTITVEFHRGSGVLDAIARLKCGDDWYGGGYDQHSKEEIINDLIIDVCEEHAKLQGDHPFDREDIWFELDYQDGLKQFTIFYGDNMVEIESEKQKQIEAGVSDIVGGWTGTFFGSNSTSLEHQVEIDQYSDVFACRDIVTYKLRLTH